MKPSVSLSIDPLSLSLASVLHIVVYTNAVLLVCSPTSDVLVAIWPYESSLSVFLSVLKITIVLSAIVPLLQTSSFHVSHPEFSLIYLFKICEVVLAMALELPVDKVAVVVASVLPLKLASSVLLPLVELAGILGFPVVPALLTKTVLLIVEPLPGVSSAIGINECAHPICHVVGPLTLVYVAISMRHPSLARAPPVLEHALVLRSIRPELNS